MSGEGRCERRGGKGTGNGGAFAECFDSVEWAGCTYCHETEFMSETGLAVL